MYNNPKSLKKSLKCSHLTINGSHRTSVNKRPDYQIITAAKSGNEQAYKKLMDRYRDSIYYMLLKMIKNKNDAEDLTIESLGKAFKNIDKYSHDFAFSTWLYKIAFNHCIDFIRKKKIVTTSIELTNEKGETYIRPIIDNGLSPEAAYIKAQKAQILRETITTLKPHYQKLVNLRYYKEFSYIEISKELNIPIGTVKAQLFRVREILLMTLKNKRNSM